MVPDMKLSCELRHNLDGVFWGKVSVTIESHQAEKEKRSGRLRRYTKPTTIIALFGSLLSIFNLYATVWQPPSLTAYAGCNWWYGRGVAGLGSNIEYFIVPVTVVNEGARTGTVLGLDLVIERDGLSTSFPASFTATGIDDKTPPAFAPIAVAGHASATTSIVFIQPDIRERPLFGGGVSFRATLRLGRARSYSYGVIDGLLMLLASPGPEPRAEHVAPVFEPGKSTPFSICKAD
jgi:hypothetical protein